MNHTLRYDNNPTAIPYEEIREAFQALPYASLARIGFGLLACTGCRTIELSHYNPQRGMKIHNIKDNTIYWRPGKSQQGYRKENLDPRFVTELEQYRLANTMNGDSIIGVQADSFRKAFHNHRKQKLPRWEDKKPTMYKGTLAEKNQYSLAGLRKSFITHETYQEIERLKDTHLACMAIAQRMLHTTTHIPEYHYIRDFKKLNLEKWGRLNMWDILYGTEQQKTIPQFEHTQTKAET